MASPAPVAIAAPAAVPVNLHRIVRDLKSSADNCKSDGKFGAQLWLIANERFFADWRRLESPKIDPIDTAIRGQPLYTAIVFYGPMRDPKGQSEVTCDVSVRKPDGSIYDDRRGLSAFQGVAADERMIILCRSYLNITLTAADPAGNYTVEATVTDNTSKTSLVLRAVFTAQ